MHCYAAPLPTPKQVALLCQQWVWGERDRATSMWDPVRPWNVECGRNIHHKIFMLLMHRGIRGTDKARGENVRDKNMSAKCNRERGKTRGNGQKARKAQVERKETNVSPSFLVFVELLGRKYDRDSRTRVLNVAQCWQSCVWVHSVGAPNLVAQCNMAIQTKQQSPSNSIYPASEYISHKPVVEFSILSSCNSHKPMYCSAMRNVF